jgi:hypothetical protein
MMNFQTTDISSDEFAGFSPKPQGYQGQSRGFRAVFLRVFAGGQNGLLR